MILIFTYFDYILQPDTLATSRHRCHTHPITTPPTSSHPLYSTSQSSPYRTYPKAS